MQLSLEQNHCIYKLLHFLPPDSSLHHTATSQVSSVARDASRPRVFELLLMQHQGRCNTWRQAHIQPFLYAWAHTHSWLASVTVIDRAERGCHPSLPPSLNTRPQTAVASSGTPARIFKSQRIDSFSKSDVPCWFCRITRRKWTPVHHLIPITQVILMCLILIKNDKRIVHREVIFIFKFFQEIDPYMNW